MEGERQGTGHRVVVAALLCTIRRHSEEDTRVVGWCAAQQPGLNSLTDGKTVSRLWKNSRQIRAPAEVESAGGKPPFIELTGICKAFGHVQALQGVDFHAYEGDVIGLVGDNGAGKSTLIKVISGAYRPDAGVIQVDGRPVTFHSPHDAMVAGIATVYQNLALVDQRDVAANIFLGRELARGASGPAAHVGGINAGSRRAP